MIRGTNVTIGGKIYCVPPANFNTLDKHNEFLQRYMAMSTGAAPVALKPTDMREMAEIIHEAVKRNYPQLSFEELAEHLDFGNVNALFTATMKAAGFEDATPGE